MRNPAKRKAAEGVETMSAASELLQIHYINPEYCPKYQGCNAPICPLDHDWLKRKHLKEDRICFYLLETAKHNAEAIFRGAAREYLYQSISLVAPAIRASHSTINRAYIRASKSGSRMSRKIGGHHA